LLFEELGVMASGEADDLKFFWKLMDDIKGIDPD
jgi:hypothetical protein